MPGVKLIFELKGGASKQTATSDSSGAYRVDLTPGTYAIQVASAGSYSRFGGPKQVTVNAGQTVTADFTFSIELL
jgi:hypothetical protein